MSRSFRPDRRALRSGLGFGILAGIVAAIGEPQPFAILVAGAGAITGLFIVLRGFEQ